jgi:hypothetical protein
MARTASPVRKTLRLTFHVAKGRPRLVSHERLDMICPPSIGDLPEVGKHGGFWLEARDAKDQVIFHRRLNDPLATSVAVHSPDGKITRVFGEPRDEHVFEVLLPDDPAIQSVVLVGHDAAARGVAKGSPKGAAGAAAGAGSTPTPSRELASFDIPAAASGSKP